MRSCAVCGVVLTGRQTKFCSPLCCSRDFNATRKADGRKREYDQREDVKARNRERLRTSFRAATCEVCQGAYAQPITRPTQRVCSQMCRVYLRHGHWPLCRVKQPRPVRLPRAVPVRGPARQGICADCDAPFETRQPHQVYCSLACGKRASHRRRRAAESCAGGWFRWADVMRLWLALDKRCGYCEQPTPGLPEPDHVVPLSRGGHNGITNILPACPTCNADKRDLSLEAWVADRARRGLPPVRTMFGSDAAYAHLTAHGNVGMAA